MDSIIMAILLCQIYVQSVEYILDDQTIIPSKCVVVSFIFTNHRSFKKEAVVSGQHYYGYCTQSDTHACS